MGLLRVASLLALLIAALVGGTLAGGGIPATETRLHSLSQIHPIAVSQHSDRAETAATCKASQRECCLGMACAHAGFAALMPSTLPAAPDATDPPPRTAGRVAGLSTAPDTGPPRLFA